MHSEAPLYSVALKAQNDSYSTQYKGSFFLLLFRCLSNGIVRVQNENKNGHFGKQPTSCIIHTKAALLVHR